MLCLVPGQPRRSGGAKSTSAWNVLDHLTDEQKPGVGKRLNAAYGLEDHDAVKQALQALHRELMDLNPSADRSLGEAMEGNPDGALAASSSSTAQDTGQHQRHRVGVLDC